MATTPARNSFDHPANPAMFTLAREARGLSLTACAKACSMSAGILRRLEWGQREPTVDELQGMADVLRFPVAFFYQTDTVMGPGLSEFYHYGRQPKKRVTKPRA